LEFTDQPSRAQVELSHRILAEGACLVLGHHAHVVQPFVDTGGGVVAFGLGNFLSDMVWDDALRRGAILTCEVVDGTVRNAAVADTFLDTTGTPSVTGHRQLISSAEVPGVPEDEHRVQARSGLTRLRRAKARYLIRNFYRMKPRFALQWVARVIRNRLPILL
jgi:poly-gamma-glutamate synthesis protein (capsule biosynthesis protein)